MKSAECTISSDWLTDWLTTYAWVQRRTDLLFFDIGYDFYRMPQFDKLFEYISYANQLAEHSDKPRFVSVKCIQYEVSATVYEILNMNSNSCCKCGFLFNISSIVQYE